jgi:hypothetical protein
VLRESTAMGWRWLIRMRTALYLLGLLALLTLVATVVPQQPNVPGTVESWLAGEEGPGAGISRVLGWVGAFDVYGSAVFLALLLLLFLSLTACLIPRIRAFVRLVRRSQPPLVRGVGRTDLTTHLATEASPEEVHATAARLLVERRWRVRDASAPDAPDRGSKPAQVAAEKGLWSREGGSLAFHLSFYVLLAAIVFGQLLTFEGQRGLVEGEAGFVDTEVSYWSYRPGRWWGGEDHRGWRLDLDAFEVDWVRDPLAPGAGQPTTFRSDVTVTPRDGEPYAAVVDSNRPLTVDGMKIHQLDWGYSPRLVVEVDGEVVHDRFLTAQLADGGGFYRTAVKAPGADPDVGLDVFLYPFAPDGEDGRPQLTGAPWADAPVVIVSQYRGNLRLGETQQTINELDTSALELRAAPTSVRARRGDRRGHHRVPGAATLGRVPGQPPPADPVAAGRQRPAGRRAGPRPVRVPPSVWVLASTDATTGRTLLTSPGAPSSARRRSRRSTPASSPSWPTPPARPRSTPTTIRPDRRPPPPRGPHPAADAPGASRGRPRGEARMSQDQLAELSRVLYSPTTLALYLGAAFVYLYALTTTVGRRAERERGRRAQRRGRGARHPRDRRARRPRDRPRPRPGALPARQHVRGDLADGAGRRRRRARLPAVHPQAAGAQRVRAARRRADARPGAADVRRARSAAADPRHVVAALPRLAAGRGDGHLRRRVRVQRAVPAARHRRAVGRRRPQRHDPRLDRGGRLRRTTWRPGRFDGGSRPSRSATGAGDDRVRTGTPTRSWTGSTPPPTGPRCAPACRRQARDRDLPRHLDRCRGCGSSRPTPLAAGLRAS